MNLVATELSFAFAEGQLRRAIFERVSFSVEGARALALLGPSGSGKTTLLKLLGRLLAPAAGAVDATMNSGRRILRGYVPQEPSMLPWLTVAENVSLGERMRSRDVAPGANQALRSSLVEAFGLAEHLNKRPRALSGGMKQRAALVNAMTSSANLLLLDEPFSGSDTQRREVMHTALLDYVGRDDERAVVFTTHDVTDVIRLADAVVWMSGSAQRQPDIILARDGWGDEEKKRLARLMLGGDVL